MNNLEFSKDKIHMSGDKPNLYMSQPLDTQTNLQDLHIDPHDPIDLKCKKLMEINQNLKYSLSIMETQLQLLKRKQSEKNNENKKLKQKLKLKSEKEIEIKRHIKLQKQKAKKQIHGYHYIKRELEELEKQEIAAREARLIAQEKKNEIYGEYQIAEEQYKKYIYQLKELEGLDEGLQMIEDENCELREKLDNIDDFLEQNGGLSEQKQGKKSTMNRVKELNEKAYALEKQEQKLINEINHIHKQQKSRAKDKIIFQEKSGQIAKMSRKIQQISTNIASKKAEFAHLDSIYKQICIEQNKLKKQYVIEKQCLEQQRKYKQNKLREAISYQQEQNSSKYDPTTYNFSKNTNKFMDSSLGEGEQMSQIQLMNIIHRYQNIKSRV